jgi:hypothetical protein
MANTSAMDRGENQSVETQLRNLRNAVRVLSTMIITNKTGQKLTDEQMKEVIDTIDTVLDHD